MQCTLQRCYCCDTHSECTAADTYRLWFGAHQTVPNFLYQRVDDALPMILSMFLQTSFSLCNHSDGILFLSKFSRMLLIAILKFQNFQ
jgi:hypothetical protein